MLWPYPNQLCSDVCYQECCTAADKVILQLRFVQPTKTRCIAFITALLILDMMNVVQAYLKVPYLIS